MPTITLTIERTWPIAMALAAEIRTIRDRMFESQESYGYGPIVTCDTEQEHSNYRTIADACWVALRQMASQGDTEAKAAIEGLNRDEDRLKAQEQDVERNGYQPGAKVHFKTPVEVRGVDYKMVTKKGGIVRGFAIRPSDMQTIYKVEVRKGVIVNQMPANLEDA